MGKGPLGDCEHQVSLKLLKQDVLVCSKVRPLVGWRFRCTQQFGMKAGPDLSFPDCISGAMECLVLFRQEFI